jgi:regulator of sigma E protease
MGSSFSMTPTTVASFILFIGILIFVHELGHFVFAKYFNIKVLTFSLGFGPPIFKFDRGETTYQVALLPLGGYVKMLGESPLDEIDPEDHDRSFHTVAVYQRALVAFAGPLFNLIFPVICFFAYFLLGPTVTSPLVGHVEVGLPAYEQGLKTGDRVVEIDGTHVWGFAHMVDLVKGRAGESLHFKIDRAGETLEFDITPKQMPGTDAFGAPSTRGIIGVSGARTGQTRIGVRDQIGREFGFVTGDRLLKVGGQVVKTLADADKVVRLGAGKPVSFVLLRPRPKQAGDLLLVADPSVVELEVLVPESARGLASLGLETAEMYIRSLEPKGAAHKAGLRAGDRVLEAGGKEVTLFFYFATEVMRSELEPIEVKVLRNGREMVFSVVNDQYARENEATGDMQAYYDAGIGTGDIPRYAQSMQWNSGGTYIREEATLTIGQAFIMSVKETGKIIAQTTLGVLKLMTGGLSLKNVGGPIMLFQVAAAAAELGLFKYLEFLAIISINLGIINLIPLPVFDGGHLMFCAIEAIKRKPVSMRVREGAMMVGLVLLAMLFVLVFSNDISRLSGGFFAR